MRQGSRILQKFKLIHENSELTRLVFQKALLNYEIKDQVNSDAYAKQNRALHEIWNMSLWAETKFISVLDCFVIVLMFALDRVFTYTG